MRMSISTRTGRPEAPNEETKMTTLSIITTRTMGYDAPVAVHGFAIVERLASVTGALLQAARRIGAISTVPALRAVQA
jgi:hypothetical protein